MNVNTSLLRSKRSLAVIAVVMLFLAGGAFAVHRLAAQDANPIPQNIRTQLPFSPFVIPNNTKGYETSDYKVTTSEDSVQILSYVIRTKDGVTVSMSEYTQPPEFSEVVEYKERFLSNVVKKYETVSTSNGTIHLGRLTRQNNKQVGVMIERGLLAFMSPEKDMDSAQWRNLGDQFVVQKVSN